MNTAHSVATTRLSSKGQVVIPESVRLELGLKEGAQFVVLGRKDVVIFKMINPPSLQDFDTLIVHARQTARQAGLKKQDVSKAIRRVRRGS
ncbi:MAG: AbrB/MazE/SpoVT family DNA-binding domain-containing protein [Deltaproteobacteria bacterium]|nr:AbrB/MazE/SpoVT family DNA-binding domain-containing protein [Deltaproteobacteria bacterium]